MFFGPRIAGAVCAERYGGDAAGDQTVEAHLPGSRVRAELLDQQVCPVDTETGQAATNELVGQLIDTCSGFLRRFLLEGILA